MNVQPHLVRAGMSLSVGGLIAAALTTTGATAQTTGLSWRHALMMQREAYHQVFGAAAIVGAPEAAASPVAGSITIKLGAKATKGVPAQVQAGYHTFKVVALSKSVRD